MRAKCPKCNAVFEVNPGISLVHFGPWRSTKCPACGKKSITNNWVNDPITWPPEPTTQPRGTAEPGFKLCPRCGAQVPIPTMFCPKCGEAQN